VFLWGKIVLAFPPSRRLRRSGMVGGASFCFVGKRNAGQFQSGVKTSPHPSLFQRNDTPAKTSGGTHRSAPPRKRFRHFFSPKTIKYA
ncbi:MAG: hypothetical protein D6714_00505, partial [Bacteroidetes bacterium]